VHVGIVNQKTIVYRIDGENVRIYRNAIVAARDYRDCWLERGSVNNDVEVLNRSVYESRVSGDIA
jgi:hypothetical protein